MREQPNLADVPTRPRDRGRARWGLAVVALGLALCLGCCTLTGIGLATSGRVRARGGPVGLVLGAGLMDVCAGAVVQPRFQVGVGWQSPVMSVMPPAVLLSSSAVCVGTPGWPAVFPYRGEWMFPP